MRAERRTLLLRAALFSVLCLFTSEAARAQAPPSASCQPTPTPIAAKAAAAGEDAGGIRLFLYGPDKKPLARKRFYLLRRSPFSAGIDWASMPKRADYLQGASPQLREWLARHDCDSLYCPEFESEFREAVKTVPEFKRAYDDGLRKYKNEKLALRWLPVNFPLKNVRTEYYRRKKAWLEDAARRAGKVASVMTDEKGAAFFTGVRPRAYFVSNLAPLEDGLFWDCQVTAGPPIPKQLHSVTVEMSAAKK